MFLIFLLARLDVTFLNFLEGLSHKFQRLTGKNCFWLSWALFAVYAIHENVYAVLGTLEIGLNAVVILFWVMQIFKFAFFTQVLRILCIVAKFSLQKFSRNILMVSLAGIMTRFIVWGNCLGDVLIPPGSITLLLETLLHNLNGVVTIYLMCCTPLPPAPSMVSKWVENLKEALTPAEPVPEGVPA